MTGVWRDLLVPNRAGKVNIFRHFHTRLDSRVTCRSRVNPRFATSLPSTVTIGLEMTTTSLRCAIVPMRSLTVFKPSCKCDWQKTGVSVDEARLTHLAYAPEIAQAMLRRQQAEAVIAARTKIVHGAVSMVDMALKELSAKDVIEMDEERKAARVSNLLVVLCGESEATPVINTGTLYN